jgi:chromosome segregation ATPase
MRQLPLFRPEAEAQRTLHEQLDHLGAHAAALEDRLQQARVAFRTLRNERDTAQQHSCALALKVEALQAEIGRHLYALDQAQLDARHWKALYEIAQMMRPPARTAPATLEPTLKQLLTIAHPDRWQRGQPAAELAHELTVIINSLREEGRP